MWKSAKYALVTGTIAYLMVGVLLFLFGISQTGWSRIDSDAGIFMADSLTFMLSEFQGWGDFWYLAVLVPWLGSSLVLALLMHWLGREAKRRRLFGGASIAAYYVVMLLVFAIGKLVTSWGHIDVNPGDVAYLLFLIWPIAGFGLGYAAATIADKIIEFPNPH
jgi:hypothetical protein